MPLGHSVRRLLRDAAVPLLLAAFSSAWASCTIGVSGLTTTYVPASGTATTITGVVTISCTALSGLGSYTITMGSGGGGSFTARRMIKSGVLLTYQIYTNSGFTTVWGDGTAGTSSVSGTDTIPLLGGTTNYPIYVKITALQNDAPGSYVDTVTDAAVIF